MRGSTPDQNLIMLDGITVYNPYHLGGVFSTFNTDAIKEADFHAGGFSARYGGRMGSILNIINREGNTEEVTGNFNLSWISAKGLIEGPLPEWKGLKGSWMLAGRRTFYDKIMRLVTIVTKKMYPENAENMPDNFFPYYFYDIEAKILINYDYSRKELLEIILAYENWMIDPTEQKVSFNNHLLDTKSYYTKTSTHISNEKMVKIESDKNPFSLLSKLKTQPRIKLKSSSKSNLSDTLRDIVKCEYTRVNISPIRIELPSPTDKTLSSI